MIYSCSDFCIATTGSAVGEKKTKKSCSWNSDSELNIHTVSERAGSVLQSGVPS